MIDFVFGPNNSFYAKANGKTFTHNLPPLLNKLLDTPGQAERIHNVALGEGLTWFAACMNIETGKNGSFFDRLPDKLHAWLYDTDEKGTLLSKRHSPTIKVFFGPGNSFLAYDKNGYTTHDLPDKLVGFLKREAEVVGTCCPTMLGLGSHDLFFVECNGFGEWHMPIEHPKLKAWVDPKYAQESGAAKYYTEGRVQHFWIDPFSTPAQLIIQDQNNWIYDIPLLGQHATASNILEEMNQYIRASQITNPTPDTKLETRAPRSPPSNEEQSRPSQKHEALDKPRPKPTLRSPKATTQLRPSLEDQAKDYLLRTTSHKPTLSKDLSKTGVPDLEAQKAFPSVTQVTQPSTLPYKLAKETMRQPKDIGLKAPSPASTSHSRHPSLKIDQPVWKEVSKARAQVVDSKPSQLGSIPALLGTHQIREPRRNSDLGIDLDTPAVKSWLKSPESSNPAKTRLLPPDLKDASTAAWQNLFRSKSSALEHTNKAATHETRSKSTQPSPRQDAVVNPTSPSTSQEVDRADQPVKQHHRMEERSLEDVHRQLAELKAQTEELTKLAIQLEQNRMRDNQTTFETHRHAQAVAGELTPIATTFANIPSLISPTPTASNRLSSVPTSARTSTSPKSHLLESNDTSPTYQPYRYSPVLSSSAAIESEKFPDTNPFRSDTRAGPGPPPGSNNPFRTLPSFKTSPIPFNSYLDAQNYTVTDPYRPMDHIQPQPQTQADRGALTQDVQSMYRPGSSAP